MQKSGKPSATKVDCHDWLSCEAKRGKMQGKERLRLH